MLDDTDPTTVQLQHVPYEINTCREFTYAPDEGHIALSIFRDEDGEYLPFPTNTCGQRRPANSERDVNVDYSDICKYKLHSVNRRAAINIPKLFFQVNKITN